MNLEKWAIDLINDVDMFWQQHAQLTSGYSVFYSPVTMNPDLMIFGLQPGGGPESFSRDLAKTLPSKHNYISEDYPLAKKMKQLFERIDMQHILEHSVKTNLNFFRARSIAEWREFDRSLRLSVANFCDQKVSEMISSLKPKRILCEGISTYEAIKRIASEDYTEEVRVENDKGKTIFIRCVADGILTMGIPHPTGSRGLSGEDWEKVQVELVSAIR